MNTLRIYRFLFIISAIVMTAVRITYQKKNLSERQQESIKGNPLALIPGAIAALTTIIFGIEYIFAPGTFKFAYVLKYPDWIRWVGLVMLFLGNALLWSAHYHLGRSFSSFIAFKEQQEFIETGPYRYIRHPIYTAYVFSYLGGGLLASNLILTFVPPICFVVMVALRIHEEETMLITEFGESYVSYMKRTDRFFPSFRKKC